jgi:voltage-gated potassium channel
MKKFRQKLHNQLDPHAWDGEGLSLTNSFILAAIAISVLATVLESEPVIIDRWPDLFEALHWVFAVGFTAELALRAWSMGEDSRFGGIGGRIRFLFQPASVTDLIATIALWIDIFSGMPGVYCVMLRLVRLLRVLTVTRNNRWAIAVRLLGVTIAARKLELALCFGFAGLVLLIAATLLSALEGPAQPDDFGSISRAMWWAIATVTTVGYGDVTPITAAGKICAGFVAFTSIAVIAMPTGILAAAFSDTFRKLRENPNKLER